LVLDKDLAFVGSTDEDDASGTAADAARRGRRRSIALSVVDILLEIIVTIDAYGPGGEQWW